MRSYTENLGELYTIHMYTIHKQSKNLQKHMGDLTQRGVPSQEVFYNKH